MASPKDRSGCRSMKRRLILLLLRWIVDRIPQVANRVYHWKAHQDPLGDFNERMVEYAFIFEWIAKLQPNTLLDVGPGTSAFPVLTQHMGIRTDAIDNMRDYWDAGQINRHFHVRNEDVKTLANFMDGLCYDMVTCISVLEHIYPMVHAFQGLASRVMPEGHLIVTMPFNHDRACSDLYSLPGSSLGKHRGYPTQCASMEMVLQWCAVSRMSLVGFEVYRCWTGNMWGQGEKVSPEPASIDDPHQYGCLLFARTESPKGEPCAQEA